MFKLNTDGTAVVKGIRSDTNQELDLDIIQSKIVMILHEQPEASAKVIARNLEKLGSIIAEAVIYSTLDKLNAMNIAAKRIEPIDIDSRRLTQIYWRLTDRMSRLVKEAVRG